MKKSNKRNTLLIVLIVMVLALALGYAAFSATLNINGTATGTGSWDVHFKQAGRFYKKTEQQLTQLTMGQQL